MSTFIALGTNLRFAALSGATLIESAIADMRLHGLAADAVSGVWETPAWPAGEQPNFFNAIVDVTTSGLGPEALYCQLASIETRFGRERDERWGPRTLDLDIIAMDGRVGVFGEVVLPHARMHERGFVLSPLAEIAPGWRHPHLGLTVTEMLGKISRHERGRRLGDLQAV